jgi:hypothetical protein
MKSILNISFTAILLTCSGCVIHSTLLDQGGNKVTNGNGLLGRYRGSFLYPGKNSFTSARCWLDLFEQDGKELRFIMGTADGGWASASPEFYEGPFKVNGDTLALLAFRRYLAEDEWGRHVQKVLDSKEGEPFQVFHLKVRKKGNAIELITNYPQEMSLKKLDQ